MSRGSFLAVRPFGMGLLGLLAVATAASASFVAVGSNGNYGVSNVGSEDGIAWVAGAGPWLRDVAKAGGLWVAVGDYGTIRTSPDGEDWRTLTSVTTSNLNALAHDGARWVAVGQAGTVLSSLDGIAWTVQCSGGAPGCPAATVQLSDVDVAGGMWVTVGSAGAILSSPNGITWTQESTGANNILLNGVGAGAGEWVAVGSNGLILTRTSAGTWTPRVSGVTGVLNSVAHGPSTWVAVGGAGILTSPGPPAWTWTAQTGATAILNGVTTDGANWLAVGAACTILSSPNAVTWTSQACPTAGHLDAAAVDGTTSVAVGSVGTVLRSVGGGPWTAQARGPDASDLRGVTHDGAQWVASGTLGAIRTGPGHTWARQTTGSTQTLWDVAHEGIHVAVGGAGTILTSTDAVAWTPQASGTTVALREVASDGRQWLAVGDAGMILASPDTVSWSQRFPGTASALWGVEGNGSFWVAVGEAGVIRTSPDGVAWTPRASGTTMPLYAVQTNGSMWVAVGLGGTILASPDGTTWTPRASVAASLYGLVTDGDLWITVGEAGRIFTSTDTILWVPRDSGTNSNLWDVGSSLRPLLCWASAGTVYVSQEVTFGGRGGSAPYGWTGGGTPASAQDTASFTTSWTEPGTYLVSVSDGEGRSRQCPPVIVNAWPTPSCAPNATEIPAGSTQLFSASGGSPPYAWSGGSGPEGAGPTFEATFAVAGTYQVVVTDALQEDSLCTVLVFDPLPPSPPHCLPAYQLVFAGVPAHLHGIQGDGAYSWWAPGAGTEAAGPMGEPFQPTFLEGGYHWVAVTSAGMTDACLVEVVQPCGEAEARMRAPRDVVVGEETTFEDASVGTLVARRWDFGDGATSTEAAPRHSFQRPGTYDVRLTVHESGSWCAHAHVVPVTVHPPPQPGALAPLGTSGGVMAPWADAGPDLFVLEGQHVTLQGSAQGVWSPPVYHWRLAQGPADLAYVPLGRNLTFTAPRLAHADQPLELQFELRVATGAAISAPDFVRVQVGATDWPPHAEAGLALEVVRGAVVQLDGAASWDPENRPLMFSWTWSDGEAVDLQGAESAHPTFRAPVVAGIGYTDLRLTVHDGRWSASDLVRVWYLEPASVAHPANSPETGPDASDGDPRPAATTAQTSHPSHLLPLAAGMAVAVLCSLVFGLVLVLWRRLRR